MSAPQSGSKARLTIDERVRRVREKLGLNDDTMSGVPVRVFVPRTADIGKSRSSSN